MIFLKKIKNNKADAEAIFFSFSVLVLILLLMFSMDLLRITWQQYAVKREIETISRVFAVSWPEAIYNNKGIEYGSMMDSKFVENLEDIVRTTAEQGKLREFTISITDHQLDTPALTNSYIYIEYKDGEVNTSIPRSKESFFTELIYGKDLYLTAKASFDYQYTRFYNDHTRSYTLTNKFANERYQKVEIS